MLSKNTNVCKIGEILGYKENDKLRNFKHLATTTRTFFLEWTAKGNIILPTSFTSNPQDACPCAREFLMQHGSNFFPDHGGSLPVWPKDAALITEALSFLFKKQAFYNYQQNLRKLKENATPEAMPLVSFTSPPQDTHDLATIPDSPKASKRQSPIILDCNVSSGSLTKKRKLTTSPGCIAAKMTEEDCTAFFPESIDRAPIGDSNLNQEWQTSGGASTIYSPRDTFAEPTSIVVEPTTIEESHNFMPQRLSKPNRPSLIVTRKLPTLTQHGVKLQDQAFDQSQNRRRQVDVQYGTIAEPRTSAEAQAEDRSGREADIGAVYPERLTGRHKNDDGETSDPHVVRSITTPVLAASEHPTTDLPSPELPPSMPLSSALSPASSETMDFYSDGAAIRRAETLWRTMCAEPSRYHWTSESEKKLITTTSEYHRNAKTPTNIRFDGSRWLVGSRLVKEIIFESDLCRRLLQEWKRSPYSGRSSRASRDHFLSWFAGNFVGATKKQLIQLLAVMYPLGDKDGTQSSQPISLPQYDSRTYFPGISTLSSVPVPTSQASPRFPLGDGKYQTDIPSPLTATNQESFNENCLSLQRQTENGSLEGTAQNPIMVPQSPESFPVGLDDVASELFQSLDEPPPATGIGDAADEQVVSLPGLQAQSVSLERTSPTQQLNSVQQPNQTKTSESESSSRSSETSVDSPSVTVNEISALEEVGSQVGLQEQFGNDNSKRYDKLPISIEVTCRRCKSLGISCINSGLGSTCKSCEQSGRSCKYSSKKASTLLDISISKQVMSSLPSPISINMMDESRTTPSGNCIEPHEQIQKNQFESLLNDLDQLEEVGTDIRDTEDNGQMITPNINEVTPISFEATLPPSIPQPNKGYHKTSSELFEPQYIRERTPPRTELIPASVTSPPQLTFFFENDDSTLDRQNPISSTELFRLSVHSIFEKFVRRTGIELTVIKFKCSKFASKRRPFCLERYRTDELAWDDIKEAMENVFGVWKAKLPDKRHFEMRIVTNLEDEEDD